MVEKRRAKAPPGENFEFRSSRRAVASGAAVPPCGLVALCKKKKKKCAVRHLVKMASGVLP